MVKYVIILAMKNLKSLLRGVKVPAQYINHEEGSVHKAHNLVAVTCCLCYPDTYELGMSNLGIELLYFRGNALSEAVVERCFMPQPDMRAVLTENDYPLFSLESQTPLKDFAVVGFSVQYELTYTNILAMIEQGGIPLLAAERSAQDPLIFIGGPCAYNPEPLGDFIDCALIGEGEGQFELFLQTLADPEIKKLSRADRLKVLTEKVPGLYVPTLRNVARRHVVKNVNDTPLQPRLIPYIDTVHNRCVVEIMRGCLHGCRYCQAGFTWRPLRPKSKEQILREVEHYLKLTGYQEVSLLTLTATDHPELTEILKELNARYAQQKINISLPSLRTETLSEEVLQEIQKVRKSTVTIAPEAGTQRMRDIIHKEMTEEDILKAARLAFSTGARSIKLYFMIGLPGETEADIIAIPELAKKILHDNGNPKGVTVTINTSTLVPKPHTPFQWVRVLDIEETYAKQQLIKEQLKDRRLQFRYHDARQSLLEAIISRADRSFGRILLAAYRAGCLYDAWQEYFSFERWLAVFAACNYDYREALKEIPLEKELPWDNIKTGVPKGYLKKEYLKALS